MKLKKIDQTNYKSFYWKRAKQRLEYPSIKVNIIGDNNSLSSEDIAVRFYDKLAKGGVVRLVIMYKNGTNQTWFADLLSFDHNKDEEVLLEESKLSQATVGDSNLLEKKFKNLNYNLDDDTFDLVATESIMTRQDKISRIIEIESFLTRKVINARTDRSGYRPAIGDEYHHLREEIKLLREEVLDKSVVEDHQTPSAEVIERNKNKKDNKGPSATVTNG